MRVRINHAPGGWRDEGPGAAFLTGFSGSIVVGEDIARPSNSAPHLTLEERQNLRAAIMRGDKRSELARAYGVTDSYVSKMARELGAPRVSGRTLCDHWMQVAAARCARTKGHANHHATREALEVEAARRTMRRAA